MPNFNKWWLPITIPIALIYGYYAFEGELLWILLCTILAPGIPYLILRTPKNKK